MRIIFKTALVLTFSLSFLLISCNKKENPKRVENLKAPVAQKIIKEFDEFGKKRLDEYFWMNNPQDSNILNILKSENEYTSKMMAHTEGLQQKLFDEMVKRVEQSALSVPVKQNGYWYYNRFEMGKEYPFLCRKKMDWSATEEVLLNVSELAQSHKIFRLFEKEVNPSNNLLAYLVDTSGDRRNMLYIKDLSNGKLLADEISDVAYGGLVWSNDGKSIIYILNDKTVRGYKIMLHTLGNDVSTDKNLMTENDNTYGLSIYKSQSKKYIFIYSHSTTTDEILYLDADDLTQPLKVFLPRQKNLEYRVNHFQDSFFYIYNNSKAKNFKLSKAAVNKTNLKDWIDVVPHSDSSFLTDYIVLKNNIVIQDKIGGLNKIRVIDRVNNTMDNVDFGEEAYVSDMYLGDEDNFEIDSIRYNYASLTTPNSVFRYDFKTKAKTILKQDKVSGYNISEFETKRVWAKSRDSVDIPLSIVYKKQLFKKDGTNPLLLYAYGSYGFSSEPYFRQDIISLLDRGFVFVIAHVRGGQELGRDWYENGKLLKKKNTFNDFIDAAECLIAEKYTKSRRLFAMGGSAGGMLMGAVINQKPYLWKGVIAEVPWMDVVTDMYNTDLPLTTLEFEEWGDPRIKEFHDYMLSWSPYDNVEKAYYPAILATGSLNDTQVPYYSPAKWVQRVRAHNTGKNPIIFKCNMDAGHGGQSGRFDRFHLISLKYAFILDCLGMNE
jgi:oligopeptidase B